MIVSGEQQRDPATHIHVSILPQTSFPSRGLMYFIWQPILSSRSLTMYVLTNYNVWLQEMGIYNHLLFWWDKSELILSLFNIFDTIGVEHLKVYFLVICKLYFVNIYLNHIDCQWLLQKKATIEYTVKYQLQLIMMK